MNLHESQIEQSQYYHVNIDRIKGLNRSPIAIIAARRGPSCPSLLESNQDSLDPTKIMAEIAKYCADEPGYIRNDMPIQEMIFRILLLRNNKPTSLEDLHSDLTETWANPTRPINISLAGLRRILMADDYYGFSP